MSETGVVFFQGIGASKFQIDRYGHLPEFDFLQHSSIRQDLPEIVYQFGWNPFYWMIGFICKIIMLVKRTHSQPTYALRFWKCNIGGRGDIEEERARHEEACAQGAKSLVFFGISRGSLVTFMYVANAFGLFRRNAVPVKLVILEGSPAAIPQTIRLRYGCLAPLAVKVLQMFTNYNSEVASTVNPLTLVQQFPKDVPVAIITSKGDEVVSSNSTCQLAEELQKAGHPNVHLLILNKASHDRYALDGDDAVRYQEFMAELRRKYNF